MAIFDLFNGIFPSGTNKPVLPCGYTVDDLLFNHMNRYGYVGVLTEEERATMTDAEIREYNHARTDYNRMHRQDIEDQKTFEKEEIERMKDDPFDY